MHSAINRSMLSRPASPVSRRSSSLSTIGHAGVYQYMTNPGQLGLNSVTTNTIPLYSRLPLRRKKQQPWRLVCHPLPQNALYRRSLFSALLLSTVASLVLISASCNGQWESVRFNYTTVFEQMNFSYSQTPTSIASNVTLKPLYALDYVVFANGHLAMPADIRVLQNNVIQEPYTSEQIRGVFVRLKNLSTGVSTVDWQQRRRRGLPGSDALGKRKPLYFPGSGQTFFVDRPPIEPDVAWIVMDYQAGPWDMSHYNSYIYQKHFRPHYEKLCKKGPPIPSYRLSYFNPNISETRVTCIQYFLKMQNNIISCVIVVHLCMSVSTILGIFATVFRNVPASMVTGVLHVTSGQTIAWAQDAVHQTYTRSNMQTQLYPVLD